MSNKYPYTNYQDVNLDWLLRKAGDIDNSAAEAKAAAIAAAGSLAAAEALVDTIEPRINAATEAATALAESSATDAAESLAAAEALVDTIEPRINAATEAATAQAEASAAAAANSATAAEQAAASVPTTLDILKAVYPVGAFYISATATSPRTIFGFGTWTQIKDRFILAAGDVYPAASSGGEARHTLTVDEMPAHTHKIHWGNATGEYYEAAIAFPAAMTDSSGNNITKSWGAEMCETSDTGGGTAHNNMPPYLTAYIWQRTA